MPRTRKAWAVFHEDFPDEPSIVFARTAAKAKASLLSDAEDCGYTPKDFFTTARARRSPANDMVLPDEHRLVAELDDKDRHIILHSFGGYARMGKEGYRDHYCTDPSDLLLLRLAWEFGLFSGPHGECAYGDTGMWSGAFFYLTELGKTVARSMLPTYQGEGRDNG